MCGITGYINLDGKPLQDTTVILNMLRVQKHRGPNDSGIRAFNLNHGESIELPTTKPVQIDNRFNGLIGFNRLSILDLSANGHQPMMSPDQKVLLTLNGEIYNAFEYKNDLIKWGYNFKSTTDTEVVLALYLRHGIEGLLEKLNGMFAIIIADLRSKTLYIARDRFGIKPMYYIYKSGILAFSSELKSFKYIKDFSFRLEEYQLDEFLLFRNNLEGSLFKEIQILTPGHYMTFSHENGLIKNLFFDINKYSRKNENQGKLDTCRIKLEEWLSKSVHSQLMSDVKLGCQLSGGIDSSIVTWLANRKIEEGNFESVSIIFNDKRFSEERYIDKVTKDLGIVSHKFLLDSDYYFNNIEKVTWHLEMPINHPNTVGIFKLSQSAKEYVTVLLSGEGADEVFGGYERFYAIGYPFQIKRVLREIRKNVVHPSCLLKYLSPKNRAIMATAFMTPTMAKRIMNGFNTERAINKRESLYQSLTGSLFDRQIKYELKSYLPDLLIRQDKMSMAHSIENRVPFLDNEVVENSFYIPEEFLLLKSSPEGYNTEKYLLKKMIANTFGTEFAFRNKMGFGIPVRDFFISPGFNQYLNDSVLPGIRKKGLFNYKLLSDWLSNIQSLHYSMIEALWVVVSFEIWTKVYLENIYEDWNTQF